MEKNDLLNRISETLPTLSKSHRALGTYIVNNYDKAAYLTASKLGQLVGISESTVVRFAIELGYEGYPELQHALRELIRTRLTAVQRMEITNSRIGDADVLDSVLHSDINKLRETLETVSHADFDRAVDMILGAKTIYIMGVRMTSSLSAFLAFNLGVIFPNVKLLDTTSGSEIFEQMLRVGEGDAVIGITFPRYSQRIIRAAEFAKKSGAGVIAITDSADSPIAEYSDCLLAARSDMLSFIDSLVAPLSIINALIVAIARRRRDELDETFEKLERVWEEFDVYSRG